MDLSDALETLRSRGFVQQITDEETLRARLRTKQITFYCGFDPTAASLHAGSLVPLMAMAHLQRAGHRAIALVGGGTAMVGDPSGKTELRQMLTEEKIQENRRAIEPQIRRFLERPGQAAEIIDNGDWLLSLNYVSFLRDIGRHFSVNRMLTAEAYRLRLEKGLSFIEFNYQLLQAYDFLVLNDRHGCELQIGGDDQWGNILAGTDLIRRVRQKDAFGLTFPLLTTAAGAKMGKTAAGALWLDAQRTSPFEFFQYFLNVDDRDVIGYLKLLTFEPMEIIAGFEAAEGADLRSAKRLLASSVTAIVHGAEAAREANAAALAAFGGSDHSGAMASVPSVYSSAGEKVVDVLAKSGLAASKSAARRLIEQGGVRIADKKVSSLDAVIESDDLADEGSLLHVGKKHVRRLLGKGS